MDIENQIEQAKKLHQQGHLREASLIYEAVLKIDPENPEPMHLLGLVAAQSGKHELAVHWIAQALGISPENFKYHNNLGTAWVDLKQFEKAIASYDSAIRYKTDYVDAHFNKGLAFIQLKDWEAAALSLKQALVYQPQFFEASYLLGNALQELGCFDEAINSYQTAMSVNTTYAPLFYNLGNAFKAKKQFDTAIENYDKSLAINPNFVDAYVNRGVALKELGYYERAIQSQDKALEIDKDYAEAHSNRGNALIELGRFEKALASYEKAIQLKRDYAEAYSNRGNALVKLNRVEEALSSYDKAIELKKDYAEAYSNRGNALVKLNRVEEALSSYDKAIKLKSDYAEAYSNRGNALVKLKLVEEALSSYDKAIELNSHNANTYFAQGILLNELKRFDKALASYDKVTEIKSDYADAYWNKSNALLLTGDFHNGWDLYEWRWKLPKAIGVKNFREPLWLGKESLQGKTILIHAEQGLGDTLQFIRYVPMVAALGATVIVEVQAPLLSLFENMQGISVLLKRGDPLPAFDVHCPMMSLPLAFKTTLDSIPACPQFVIPEVKTQHWANQLGLKTKPRVGLVWNGGFHPDHPEIWDINERRNLPLQHLKALSGVDVEFISLQKGEPAESEFRQAVAAGWDGPVIHDHVHELKDFSDTAALVMNLDLVIAVDTSTAHLAASLGKPVWLLNRYDTCWRWLLEREDSPWYPSIKIYRQTSAGDWDGVMQRVRVDLLELASRHVKK